MGNWISDGDNDDSLTLFHETACQQELQNGYLTHRYMLDSASGSFFFFSGDLRLRRWRSAEGPVAKSLLPLSLRSVGSPCQTAGHRCHHRYALSRILFTVN